MFNADSGNNKEGSVTEKSHGNDNATVTLRSQQNIDIKNVSIVKDTIEKLLEMSNHHQQQQQSDKNDEAGEDTSAEVSKWLVLFLLKQIMYLGLTKIRRYLKKNALF